MQNDSMSKINNYKLEGIEFVEITNNVGMSVTFTNFGASIYSIKYDGKLMTYQAKDVKDFLREDVYNGKSIGRVAGRIKGSTLKLGNKTYKLKANEGENVLHGGKNGLSSRVFSTRVFTTTEHVHVVYDYFSDARHSGFPGNALFEVHYIVSNNKPKIKIKLLSYVTEKSPISLTNHVFFSLGEPNLKNTSLQVKASKYLEINPSDLIVGREANVTPCLDFRKMKPILKDIDAKEINQAHLKGYDHYFIFDEHDDEVSKIIMENDKYRLSVFSDFEAGVIYTDNFDPHFEADSSKEKTRRGVAIEPQLNPSKSLIMGMGEEFDHFIRFEFEKK